MTVLKARRESLLMSASAKLLIRFKRPYDRGGTTSGYIIDRGPQFFLLALVADNLRFDGFTCIRYRDVRDLQAPARYAKFVESALKLRNEHIPRRPAIKLNSASELLTTAGRAFSIVTIHRESVDPDICHIGRVVSVDKNKVDLLEIGPDAQWETRPIRYRTREITRIDFGGSYEEALTLVGGPAPEVGRPNKL